MTGPAPGSSRSGTSSAPGEFAGIPEEALDFYDDLEQDNSKAFWEARREQYQRAVRDPMERLAIALSLLADPALDALLDGPTPFESLPDAMPRILAAPGPLCHVVTYGTQD